MNDREFLTLRDNKHDLERKTMTTIEAIKEYFGPDHSVGIDPRKVENKELLELKKALSTEAWEEMGQACCKALGTTWSKS